MEVPEPYVFRCPECKSVVLITILERRSEEEELMLYCPFQDTFQCINAQLEQIHPVPEEELDDWLKDT